MSSSLSVSSSLFFRLLLLRPPTSTLFPYTTLFRSVPDRLEHLGAGGGGRREVADEVVGTRACEAVGGELARARARPHQLLRDRKSTRLNSSHSSISYAVFCLKKKKK